MASLTANLRKTVEKENKRIEGCLERNADLKEAYKFVTASMGYLLIKRTEKHHLLMLKIRFMFHLKKKIEKPQVSELAAFGKASCARAY